MNIANPQEGTSFKPKDVYLGKALYKVIAVNPTKEELKAMGQYVPEGEVSYAFSRDYDGKVTTGVNIKVYLQNVANHEIIDTVTYSLINENAISSTGKYAVINKYGADTWLEPAHLDAGTMPENMSWYVNEGVKKAVKGEKELIDFIRASRNFKKISGQSTAKDKAESVSVFEQADLDKIFRQDFSDIRKVLVTTDNLKVGFVLGVRTADNDKKYQDIYKEYPLRPYMIDNDGSNEYIAKSIADAQANGRYKNTFFDIDNFKYRMYDENTSSMPAPDNGDDLFAQAPSTAGAGLLPDNDLPF